MAIQEIKHSFDNGFLDITIFIKRSLGWQTYSEATKDYMRDLLDDYDFNIRRPEAWADSVEDFAGKYRTFRYLARERTKEEKYAERLKIFLDLV